MRLKSFYAKTMTEAMQMVRDMLGEDAVIVATREERGGAGGVHVTAAVEPAFELNKNGAAESNDWLQYDDEQDEFAVAEELTEVMLRHNVPEDVMDNVISCATVIGMENPGIALIAAIEHLFNFRPLPVKAHNKAIMMVGPPGAGKTIAVAKMAARSAMNGLSVGVVSCDTVRAGGVEQLQSFTNLLNIDLKKAASAKELQAVLASMRGVDQILIDSPGINPFSTDDIKTLARFLNSDGIDPYLVMPAGIDAEEAGEMARAFATLGVNTLIPTRVDMARRLGSILAAAHSGSLALADASNTPKVADGLFSLTPKSLATLLMPGAYSQHSSAAAPHRRKTGTQ